MEPLNRKLASIFNDMSYMYSYLDGDNRFRARAYAKASQLLEHMEQDPKSFSENELESLEGIGHGIATKIEEFIATGKISKYEELKSKVPPGILNFSKIKGLGAKTLRIILNEFKITSVQELTDLIKNGRLSKLKGFGPQKIENLMKAVKLYEASRGRIPLWYAMEVGNKLIKELEGKDIEKIALAGSIRRSKEYVGDIDILVACKEENRKRIIERFTSIDGITKILAKGKTKVSAIIGDKGLQIDIRLVNPDEWGSALLYFTGSKQHNIHLRKIAKARGMKLNEYGIFSGVSGKRIVSETEEAVYKALNMNWIPPELREDDGEVEAALKQTGSDKVKLKELS